ncbi:MAG: dihydropteroate synthase [Firmicutes bacterium]|nr:dihydropteroate synthase [Bacillota bacterium]
MFWEIGFKPLLMAILNITPDSFSEDGEMNPECALNRALQMEEDGADIIDVGGQSTRPGFKKISPEEEIKRVEPVLKLLKKNIKILISIDTFYPDVVEVALNYGVNIINDVTGFKNIKMINKVAKSDCGLIVVHGMKTLKNPKIHKCNRDIIKEIQYFFNKQLIKLKESGIDNKRICFDPGIGFAKTYEENLKIIKNIKNLKIENIPILIGASRKRIVSISSGQTKSLCGTIAIHSIASFLGANIIRCHDVKETRFALNSVYAILKSQ